MESKDTNQNSFKNKVSHTLWGEKFVEKTNDFFDKKTLKALFLVILGSLIYCFAVMWFYNLGNFFAGGVTGTSQLIAKIVGLFTGKTYNLGLLVGLINLPLFLIGWKGVSKKFAVLSLVSVVTQTITLFILEEIGFQPLTTIISSEATLDLTKYINSDALLNGIDTTITISFNNSGGRLLLAVLGGGIAAIGASMCLKAGGSTGGMDIISNSLLMKKNLSFVKVSFIVDIIIIICSAFFELESALYTIVRLVVYSLAVDHFYTIYRIVKIEIITDHAEELRSLLLNTFHHGMTIYDVKGGYTLQSKKSLEILVSSYEVDDYVSAIRKNDPGAFMVISGVNVLHGNYKKRTIV